MKLTMAHALTAFFVLITVIAAGFIAVSTMNYQNYYWQARSAMLDSQSNNTMVETVRLTKDQSTGLLMVRANVSATNPTNYNGLTLDSFDLVLFFTDASGNRTLFSTPIDRLLLNTRPAVPLAPQSTYHAVLSLELTLNQTRDYESFNQTLNGQTYSHTILTTQVDSFLDPVFGKITTLKDQENPILR